MKELIEEYKPHFSIFSEEDNKTYMLKHILFNDLTDVERVLIVLYAELGSQRKVANKLNVSPATVNLTLNKVRTKIKTIY